MTKGLNKAGKSSPALNKVLWLTICVLFALGLYGNYFYLQNISGYFRVAGWIVLFAVMFGLAALTNKGKAVLEFVRSAKLELRKVSWPTRQETVQTTFIVMIMIVVVALVLWGVDSLFMWAVSWLTGQRG